MSPFGLGAGKNAPPTYPSSPWLKTPEPPIHSIDEVEALMGNTPSWILRSGIGLVACMVLAFLFLAWRITFPDTVATKVTLVTEKPPIRIVSPTSGKISQPLLASFSICWDS